MRSLILAIAIGLVGAALVHIIAILAMPQWTGTDTWTRVAALGERNRFFILANEPNTTSLYNDDPHIRTAVCRFDIGNRPVRITASSDVALWTFATYSTSSDETFSMNDRSSIGADVDIALVTAAQMLQLRRAMPATLERTVLVELAEPVGYAVLRAIVPAPSHEPAARAFLSGAACVPFTMDP